MNPLQIGASAVTAAYQNDAAKVGISEADIRRLVPAFYANVRRDPILGPVFDGIIGDNWPAHIDTVCSFWLSATRLDRRYDGRNFTPAHVRHPAIRADLLAQWLTIFRTTAWELCTPAQADALVGIAERMAGSLAISLNKRDGLAGDPTGLSAKRHHSKLDAVRGPR